VAGRDSFSGGRARLDTACSAFSSMLFPRLVQIVLVGFQGFPELGRLAHGLAAVGLGRDLTVSGIALAMTSFTRVIVICRSRDRLSCSGGNVLRGLAPLGNEISASMLAWAVFNRMSRKQFDGGRGGISDRPSSPLRSFSSTPCKSPPAAS
jgi:hypothetical protein